jgi:hypothetical protein
MFRSYDHLQVDNLNKIVKTSIELRQTETPEPDMTCLRRINNFRVFRKASLVEDKTTPINCDNGFSNTRCSEKYFTRQRIFCNTQNRHFTAYQYLSLIHTFKYSGNIYTQAHILDRVCNYFCP